MNVAYPFQIDARGRIAAANVDDHVRDLVEQLLFTNPGERVNRPTFGSGLGQLVFAPNSEALAASLQLTVQGALQQWLGDIIEVQDLGVVSEESTLTVTVSFRNRLNGRDQNVQLQKAF